MQTAVAIRSIKKGAYMQTVTNPGGGGEEGTPNFAEIPGGGGSMLLGENFKRVQYF
jgi:hypothetical protein